MSLLSPVRWILGFGLLRLGTREVPHGGKILLALVIAFFVALVWLGLEAS